MRVNLTNLKYLSLWLYVANSQVSVNRTIGPLVINSVYLRHSGEPYRSIVSLFTLNGVFPSFKTYVSITRVRGYHILLFPIIVLL